VVKPQIPAPGEVWWIDLQPSAGKEQRGRHAGLVLSARQFNFVTGFAFMAPITTIGKASRGNNFAVTLSGAGTSVTGVIQIDQIKSMDWRTRNAQSSGERVPGALLNEVLERFAPIFGLGVLYADDGEAGE
jgi:mRNA interferase MazF/mRNA interferase ChpB